MYTCVAVAVLAVLVAYVNGAPVDPGPSSGEVDQMRRPRPTPDTVIGHYPIKMILDLLRGQGGFAPSLQRARKDRNEITENELLKMQLESILQGIAQFPIKMNF
ncbi:uncharacterized protein LOC124279603 [Haliotis rubra]|uniref:uncharacterized protein LOC124279603 n=1 Tax=Haliotis rubra TaxID=36100 RepID=UPI001EE5FF87|nr:uncharacterized protein LOC124279603 [Haliotis rubra]